MQLGKKSKTTDMFERVRGDLGVSQAEESAPLVPAAASQTTSSSKPSQGASGRTSLDRPSGTGQDSIHVTLAESISAKLSREGTLKAFSIKGDLSLKITDPALTKVKLDLSATASHGAQFRTHPNVDKPTFNSSQAIQLKDSSRGFPANNSVAVLRWTANPGPSAADALPITFTVWVNKGSDDTFTVTIEYELTGDSSSSDANANALSDVSVLIPYATSEPAVASFDAIYEVSGDSLEWKIGPVDASNSSGSFEFEAQTEDDAEFFPMRVSFARARPMVDVDVSVFLFLRVFLFACFLCEGGRGAGIRGKVVFPRFLFAFFLGGGEAVFRGFHFVV